MYGQPDGIYPQVVNKSIKLPRPQSAVKANVARLIESEHMLRTNNVIHFYVFVKRAIIHIVVHLSIYVYITQKEKATCEALDRVVCKYEYLLVRVVFV